MNRRLLLGIAVGAGLTVLVLGSAMEWLVKLLVLGYLIASAAYWVLKTEAQRRQLEELQRLRHTHEQLDQQTKLILRTDLELHRTQEELDRKLASLFALHELGQQLRISLRPEAIYGKLNAQLVTSFGFSRGLAGMQNPSGELMWQALVGLSEEHAAAVHRHLTTHDSLRRLVTDSTPHRWDLDSTTDPALRTLLELLDSHTVVLIGIRPHTGPAGCLMLAREGVGPGEGHGDEELAAILATQLVIAIENSALYEDAWRSRQELEHKVQQRTKELASANEQLIRLNKAKSDFVSAVSHELRTPLAAIKGYASLLHSGQFGPLQPPQAERVAKIEKHTDLLTQLINNLLDIARIESGRVTMEHRSLNLQDLLGSVVEVIKPQADAKRIRVAVDADGITQVSGDPTHLPRVLINLLSNAVKYSPEHGTIAVTLARQGARIVASVRDQGCGIAPTDVPKLFQEFYRAANPVNEHVRGTGLGLALVKRIIEAHQGTIWVDSEVNKGTTVTFALPVEAAPESS